MKRYLLTLATTFVAIFATAQDQAPAFPGAEGHGRYVTGGRGGTIVHVTNLNNSGTGSFRAAVTGGANRIIVFDVAGVIPLSSDITFKDNITILGQTAPYPGITLRYFTVRPGANNVIRFIRFRRGQERDTNDGADASWQRQKTGIIFDHCSFSWSIDEVASFYDNNNFTMQWCTLGESLNNAGHGKGAHGYGGIWGGKLASFHHNMICHVNNRSPRFCGARYDWTGYTGNKLYSQYNWQNAVQAENVDFRNCVVYNANGCYGGPGGGQINMVGNYYKSGPAATIDRITTVSYGDSENSSDNDKYWGMTSRYYLEDNMIDGSNVSWEKMKYDSSVPTLSGQYYTYDENHYYGADSYTKVNGKDGLPVKLDAPAPAGEVTTHSAATAYEKITTYCGASLYRDEVDERYMNELISGTATYSGSVTKKPGRIDLVSDCNGYTEANFPTGSREAGFDSDNDGIPDAWETVNGLNPSDASDAKTYTLDAKGWYTNLEVYANSLVQDIMVSENTNAESSVEEYYPGFKKADGTVVETIDPSEAKTYTLSEGTYQSTSDNVWSFENGFSMTGGTTFIKGTYLNGFGYIVNSGKTYTIKLPEGMAATKVTFTGYCNVNNQTAYLSEVNGTKFESSDYVFPKRDGENTKTKSFPISLTTPTNEVTFKIGSRNVVLCIDVTAKLSGTSGISTLKNEGDVIATEYYDLHGQRLSTPRKGIIIKVEKKTNGEKVVKKVNF